MPLRGSIRVFLAYLSVSPVIAAADSAQLGHETAAHRVNNAAAAHHAGWQQICRRACCCVDDYCSKPLPPMPQHCMPFVADDYCRKSFCVLAPTAIPRHCADYCKKPLPRMLCSPAGPYTCGPGDCPSWQPRSNFEHGKPHLLRLDGYP